MNFKSILRYRWFTLSAVVFTVVVLTLDEHVVHRMDAITGNRRTTISVWGITLSDRMGVSPLDTCVYKSNSISGRDWQFCSEQHRAAFRFSCGCASSPRTKELMILGGPEIEKLGAELKAAVDGKASREELRAITGKAIDAAEDRLFGRTSVAV